MERPVLIVGDIQGDYERLLEALEPYPDAEYETIFLGDFFQGGRLGAGGGAEAARIAMRRANSRAVLGNHDLFLLAMLEQRRDPQAPRWMAGDGMTSMEAIWLSRRGDWADLEAVGEDEELERWLRTRPLMLLLEDRTLVQHTDDDRYAELGGSVDEVNAAACDLLAQPGGVLPVLRHTIGRRAFDDHRRLHGYLRHFGAARVVHGHTPHFEETPHVRHDGRVIGFDGRFSRYWGRSEEEVNGPITATVGLLPPLPGEL